MGWMGGDGAGGVGRGRGCDVAEVMVGVGIVGGLASRAPVEKDIQPNHSPATITGHR